MVNVPESYLVDKILVVVSVGPVTELASGDSAYQVIFGRWVDTTPELVSRLPADQKETAGKQTALNELEFLMKHDKPPYKVGSKWRFTISKNGAVSMVEL